MSGVFHLGRFPNVRMMSELHSWADEPTSAFTP